MEYFGPSENWRVKIIATKGTWARFNGQECDATFYEPDMNVHINSEQLNPPLPKWQSALPSDVEKIRRGW